MSSQSERRVLTEIVVNTQEIPWEDAERYGQGTKQKVLRQGPGGEMTTLLLKLPAGFAMGAHSHTSVEHHYVLEGEYEVGGRHFPAGTYQLIPKGTTHGPFRSARGAVVLAIWE
jgi:anti-sigma factor ChrR (cupin superfamily)